MDHPLFETLVQKTPATVALHLILDRLLPPQRLDELFTRMAQAQYQKQLLFSQLVELSIDVVLGEQPSVLAAFHQHAPRLSVSFKSVYNKLNSMELPISAALVADSARQAHSLIQSLNAAEPSWLPGYRIRILDGNSLSATDRRIEELRTFWDAPLPGKVLAVMDQTTRLVTDLFVTPDGHASERSLLSEVIEAVQANDLWIADRNFCTHNFLHQIDERKASFVIRQHGQVHGKNPGEWSVPVKGETGMISEQSLQILPEGTVKTFRRIRCAFFEPTRDGETEIDLLTNLPETVSAVKIAEIYRKRWSIEHLFLEMSETLECEQKGLCQPKAFLFLFCLGLVASNAIQVFKGGMRQVHDEKIWTSLSLFYLMWEVHQSSHLVRLLVGEDEWRKWRDCAESDWLTELRRILKAIQVSQYQKSKTRTRPPPTKRSGYRNGAHTSTHKILEERKKSKKNGTKGE